MLEWREKYKADGKKTGAAQRKELDMAPTILDTSKRYVLVAEDNQMIQFATEQILKMLGYTPIIADNGKIAVEKFNSFLKDG